MEYVDGQLVGVRDRLASTKATEGESRTKVLQELFSKKKDESSAQSTTSNVRHSQFKVVHNKRNSILDTDHPAGWVNRTTEREDTALKGQDWRSETYVPVTCLSEYALTFAFLKLAVSKLFNLAMCTCLLPRLDV
ncbi:hypothetical protein PILCRDRAFT_7573 [Piloderma croceum F 1598]|uniref:HAM1-like C-terminal domain-containing protein n=1 Tax=Piloderma croceum (strain F 1598) TaxID=765440 RepID=A0A0C3FVV1_PILCF|nr:hypothetical protein PILCRDRAFT_7573 [Piloderma croceum F 1598]